VIGTTVDYFSDKFQRVTKTIREFDSPHQANIFDLCGKRTT